MLHMRRAALLMTVFSLGTVPAMAAEVSDAQARVVEGQIADWLHATLGPAVTLPDRPVQLTAEATDYAVLIPLGGVAMTGKLAPGDDGLWRLSGMQIPSPSTFTVSMPQPGKAGEPMQMVPTTYTVTLGTQSTDGVFDPSYRQASTLAQKFTELKIVTDSASVQQTTTIAGSDSTTRMVPLGNGRFDVTSAATLTGYSLSSSMPGKGTVRFDAQSGKLASQLSGVSGERGPALMRASFGIIASVVSKLGNAGATAPGSPGDAQMKALALEMVNSLDGVATQVSLDESLTGARMQIGTSSGGGDGTIGSLHLGMGGSAPGGLLTAYLDVGLDQVSVPSLAGLLGPFADLVPHSFEMRPTVSGISSPTLLALLRTGLQDGAPPPDFSALLKAGPITVGLDRLAFDVGPAGFTGKGSVVFTSPTSFAGSGQVTATNLDALIQRASTDPAMRSVFAVMTVAKGIGHTQGEQTVWDITYQNGKALVNGVDVMAMAGQSAAPPAVGPPMAIVPPVAPAPSLPAPAGKPPPR